MLTAASGRSSARARLPSTRSNPRLAHERDEDHRVLCATHYFIALSVGVADDENAQVRPGHRAWSSRSPK